MVTKSKVGVKRELSIFYRRITVYLYISKSVFLKEWFNRERNSDARRKKNCWSDVLENAKGYLSESKCSV